MSSSHLRRRMSRRMSRWLSADEYNHDYADPALRPSAYQNKHDTARSSWHFDHKDIARLEKLQSKINRYIPASSRGPYGELTTSWISSLADRAYKVDSQDKRENDDDYYYEDDARSETAVSDCSCCCCRNECGDHAETAVVRGRRLSQRREYPSAEHSEDDCPECSGQQEESSNSSNRSSSRYRYYDEYKRRFKEIAVRERSRGRSRSKSKGRWYERYVYGDDSENYIQNSGNEQQQPLTVEAAWGNMKPHILNSIRDRIGRDSGDDLREDDAYLSYHDVCLRKEDVDCLRDDWLTDNNIAFWEEFLEHEILSVYSDNKIFLLRPSMVYMILQTRDPRTLIAALPKMREEGATHIFLPINDNKNPEMAEGGSHWSLLVIGVTDGLAFHYDSLASSNVEEARRVTTKMEVILNRHLNFVDLLDTPQQENSTDCGVHVCLNMRYLLVKRLLSATARDVVDMSLHGQGRKLDASSGRKEMYRIVSGLRRLAERSASPGNRKSGSPPRIE